MHYKDRNKDKELALYETERALKIQIFGLEAFAHV
jgi:hypothetical protein